jgi:hypothetical protein
MKFSNNRKRMTLLCLGIIISLIALWILLFETSKFPEDTASHYRHPAQLTFPHHMEAKNWISLPVENSSNAFNGILYTQEFVRISFKLTEHVLKIKISL